MKRLSASPAILATLSLVGAALCGCARHELAGDGGGRPRVVSLAPNVTEILFAIGAGDGLVGVTNVCDDPPEARGVEQVGGFGAPNLEKVLAMAPDLVIGVAGGWERRESADVFRNAGIRVLDVRTGSFEELFGAIVEIGDAVGAAKEGRALAVRLRAELDAAAPAVGRRPTVFVEVEDHPLCTAGGDSFLDDVITRAGGVNAAHAIRKSYARINPETVIQWNPEVILVVTPGGQRGARERFARRIGWDGVSAVRQGRIIDDIPPELLARPGPRSVEGVKALAERLRKMELQGSPSL
jgi:iron complex transport system substrate-binding protein